MVLVNVLAAGDIGRPVAISLLWLLVLGWLGPAVGALAIAVLVVISARVRGFQEAYQLGGVVVLPVLLLVIGQLVGAIVLDARLALLDRLRDWGDALAAGLGD